MSEPQADDPGYRIVRGLIPPHEIASMKAAFSGLVTTARHLATSTDHGGARFVLDADPFRLHRVVWCGGASPVLARYGDDSRFTGLAAEVLGGPDLVQLIQQAHFKLPGDGVDFAWHQDASNRRYGSELWTDVDGRGSFVQIALAIDAMGAHNGGLQVIPGSQKLGFIADPETGALPPSAVDEARAITPELQPGDALVFGPFLIHGSPPNRSDQPRRLFLQGYALPGANRRVYPGSGTGVPRRWRGPPERGTLKAT